jgi:hypothetical protein
MASRNNDKDVKREGIMVTDEFEMDECHAKDVGTRGLAGKAL